MLLIACFDVETVLEALVLLDILSNELAQNCSKKPVCLDKNAEHRRQMSKFHLATILSKGAHVVRTVLKVARLVTYTFRTNQC